MTELLAVGVGLGIIGTIWFGFSWQLALKELAKERGDRERAQVEAQTAHALRKDEVGRLEALLLHKNQVIKKLEETRDRNETPDDRLARARAAGAGGSLLPSAEGAKGSGDGRPDEGLPQGATAGPAGLPGSRKK